jgi:hypothetical protein
MVVTEAAEQVQASEEFVSQVTDELIQKEQEKLKPEQAAEMVFRYYWPKYQLLVSHLSNKDARKLNEAVVGYPLELTTKNFFSKEAKEAFNLAKVLMDAKFILQQSALSAKLKEIGEAKVEEGTSTEAKTETVTEGA